MKPVLSALPVVFALAGCAGGMPPTSSNGLNAYDVLFGFKEVPEGADTSRVWSPVHQIYGGKPDWSIVWFKEKTRDGKPYELTAKPTGEGGQAQNNYNPDLVRQAPPDKLDQLNETALLLFGEVKTWFNRVLPQ